MLFVTLIILELIVLELSDSQIVEILLHRRKFLDISSNTNILKTAIDFLLGTKRFDERLF